jgi:Domain of unknown function (DUF4390)
MKPPHRLLWSLTLVVIAFCAQPFAADLGIRSVTAKIADGFYFVDPELTLELGTDAREAIENGVPLIFIFDFRIDQPRRYLWNKNLLSLRRSFELARHPLANSYVVTDIVANKRIASPSLDDALRILSEPAEITLGKATLLDSSTDLLGRMRAQLDIESLPAPLRPIAYVSPSWRLKSDWFEWKLQQ